MGDSKQFTSPNFNPDKYVKEISQNCVGGVELHQQKEKLQAVADETNNLLKKNVYHNYTLFIDAAKDISRLEGDMYQLSHLLTEQRSLLTTLASSSIFDDHECVPSSLNAKELQSLQSKEEDEGLYLKRKQAISDIAEKIEGCINLTENSGRFLLYEGDLAELDGVDNAEIGKFYSFLLSDVLLLTTNIANRRTLARYKLQTVYDVGNLAVVNVKDVPNAFKVLAFPDTRVFKATTSQAKVEWLEKFDEAKKTHMSGLHRRRSCANLEHISPIRTSSLESPPTSQNPFDEIDEETVEEEELPDWVMEVAEDLDVLIVERHFEEAYALIEKARHYLKETPPANEISARDIEGKIDVRVKNLTDVLTKELDVAPNKSHQGGLRAARRTVRLLNTLQKSTRACDLFLKLCSNLLQTQMNRVKRDTAPTTYAKRASAVFFSNLCEMTKEFQYRAFPNNPSCSSAFIVWCVNEVNYFMAQISRQVFAPNSSLSVLSQCVEYLHQYAQQLCDHGLDMMYLIDGQLRAPLTTALSEARDKLMDGTKQRIRSEKWHVTDLKSQAQVDKFLTEFKGIGLDAQQYIKDKFLLQLTNNTITFCKQYLAFLKDSLSLNSVPNIGNDLEAILYEIFSPLVGHFEQFLRQEAPKHEKITLSANAKFLAEEFLPKCEEIYVESTGMESEKLRERKFELENFVSRRI